MLKKTITFKDLDDNDVTEDFYFNLNKAELVKLEAAYQPDGFHAYLQELAKPPINGTEIMEFFDNLIRMSVGKRSDDNKRFIKNEEVTNDFMQTDAYTQMFMDFCTNPEAAAQFVTAVMPSDLVEAFQKGQTITDVALPDGEQPAYIRENRAPTPEELRNMSQE